MNIGLRVVLPVIGSLLVGGCTFFGLRDDLRQLDAATTISGTIKTNSPLNKPILVALYEPEENDKFRLRTFSVRYGSGGFEFLVESGDYYLVAFEDANEDFTFQDSEFVGWHGAPTLIEAPPRGEHRQFRRRTSGP